MINAGSWPESEHLCNLHVQVLLCYGLRGRLQAALLPPAAGGPCRQARAGTQCATPVSGGSTLLTTPAAAAAAALEPQILRLLLELDVPDDATRGRAGRTRYSSKSTCLVLAAFEYMSTSQCQIGLPKLDVPDDATRGRTGRTR